MSECLDRRRFARRVGRLPPARFREFVGALHAHRADVTVVGPDGPVIDGAPPGADDRILYAYHPRDAAGPDRAADGSVSPLRSGPGAGPAYLFDLARFGTGVAGDAACRSFLGGAPAGPPDASRTRGPWRRRPDESARAHGGERLRVALASRFVPTRASLGTVPTASVAVLLAVAVVIGAGTSLPVGPNGGADGTGGGTVADAGTVGTPESPRESDARRTEGSEAGSPSERYASLRPTCDRPPERVVRIQVGALRHTRPDSDTGIRTAYAFASPSMKRVWGPFEQFVYLLRNPPYDLLLDNRRVDYGPMEVTDGTVRQYVTVTGADGRQRQYDWYLTRVETEQYDGCWLTRSIVLNSDPPR